MAAAQAGKFEFDPRTQLKNEFDPRTHMMQRAHSHQLSSDLQTHGPMHMCVRTHTQTYIIKILNKSLN